MSYNPGTRIPNFSNPSVFYDGMPTGIPASQSNSADNARTVNETSGTVAFYLPAVDMVDCNGNFRPDAQDIADGTSQDCNGNDRPDECDVASGDSSDSNGNNVPDECECDASQCDDGVLCTVDSCNPSTGGCNHTTGGVSYGDVNQSGMVDLEDVQCILAGYESLSACVHGDIAPCQPDGLIDLADLLAVLDAYNGVYLCASPCP